MLIHNRMDSSAVNGPGNRAVLWMQGCSIGCPGCWNPTTHAFNLSAETPIDDIMDWLKGLKDIEGITFSGGEPLQQAGALYLLCHRIRQELPQLSIGMFSGYTFDQLEIGRFKWKSAYDADWIKGTRELWIEIKNLLDFGVMGPYKQAVQTRDKPLCGSLNQEVVFFSSRYSAADLEPQTYEVTISPDGETSQVTGFPVGVKLEV